MRNATQLLTQYAAYHRDRRNIASHLIGVPLIVFGVGVLLARVPVQAGGVSTDLAWIAFAVSAAWYLSRGNALIGTAVTAAVGGLIALGQPLAGGSLGAWLGWGLGSFVVGWAIQFVGHRFEGRKPAFVDDLVGLLVGPMFVVAEGVFACGGALALRQAIEREAGPLRGGRARRPAA